MKYEFNVLIWSFNKQHPEPYNVIPYFQREWYDEKNKDRFRSFEDIKQFIDSKAKYQFWARCEYEIIIESWPVTKDQVKLDVYDQIKMNLDLITTVFMKSIGLKLK